MGEEDDVGSVVLESYHLSIFCHNRWYTCLDSSITMSSVLSMREMFAMFLPMATASLSGLESLPSSSVSTAW